MTRGLEFSFTFLQTLGGVPPVPGYLKAMKDVCDRHGALFILDEVFAGMGNIYQMHTRLDDIFADLLQAALVPSTLGNRKA